MTLRIILPLAASVLTLACASGKSDVVDDGLVNLAPNKLGQGNLVGRRLQGALPPLGSYELQDFDKYHGQVVALVVWESGSSRSRDALNYFAKVADEYKDRGAQVVSINVDSDYHVAELTRDEAKISFPILSDPNGELTRKLGLTELPAALIVDGEGLVAAQFSGYDERLGAAMLAALHDEVKSQPVKLANDMPVHKGPVMASLDEAEMASAKPAVAHHVGSTSHARKTRSHRSHHHHKSHSSY
jgi:peroxiredoxin